MGSSPTGSNCFTIAMRFGTSYKLVGSNLKWAMGGQTKTPHTMYNQESLLLSIRFCAHSMAGAQAKTQEYIEDGKTTPVGFEPTRGDPIGLAGRRLNRSAKVSSANVKRGSKMML